MTLLTLAHHIAQAFFIALCLYAAWVCSRVEVGTPEDCGACDDSRSCEGCPNNGEIT